MTDNLVSADNANMSSISDSQPKEFGSLGDEHTPKVRKAYTITKQRERWTDEEHNKFVEALKLHGRAWRQIEEHIGTKTAVQIRSHAQKFFSKVVREPGSNNTSSLQPTEIPPPRPKRKPSHPYPRKMGNLSGKGLAMLKKSERSPSPMESTSEAENRSPTSVLSAIGSDILGSSASNTPKHCGSFDSYANCFNPSGIPLVEQENICLTCPSAAEGEGENGSPLSGSTSAAMTTEDKSAMDIDNAFQKEDTSVEAPVTSLKLFGRTVVVSDPTKHSSLFIGEGSKCPKLMPSANKVGKAEEDIEADMHSSSLTQTDNMAQQESSTDSGQIPWNTWPCVAPQLYYCLPSQQEYANAAQDTTIAPLPWWSYCGGLQFPLMHFSSSNLNQHFSAGIAEKSADVVEHDCKLPSSLEEETNKTKTFLKEANGFLPYKRCSTDRETNKTEVSEGQEHQRIRLCL